MMKVTLSFILGFVLFSGFGSAPSPDSKRIYYADFPNPPAVEHDPGFEGTRRLFEDENFPSLYLNIRYPAQKDLSGKLEFLISVGHELKDMILFEVNRLELRYEGRLLTLKPSFLNQDSGKTEEGMSALREYRHRVPPYDHRRIQLQCEDCRKDYAELDLWVEVSILTSEGNTRLGNPVRLYRGLYRSRGIKS